MEKAYSALAPDPRSFFYRISYNFTLPDPWDKLPLLMTLTEETENDKEKRKKNEARF